jgi:hypothetical protein
MTAPSPREQDSSSSLPAGLLDGLRALPNAALHAWLESRLRREELSPPLCPRSDERPEALLLRLPADLQGRLCEAVHRLLAESLAPGGASLAEDMAATEYLASLLVVAAEWRLTDTGVVVLGLVAGGRGRGRRTATGMDLHALALRVLVDVAPKTAVPLWESTARVGLERMREEGADAAQTRTAAAEESPYLLAALAGLLRERREVAVMGYLPAILAARMNATGSALVLLGDVLRLGPEEEQAAAEAAGSGSGAKQGGTKREHQALVALAVLEAVAGLRSPLLAEELRRQAVAAGLPEEVLARVVPGACAPLWYRLHRKHSWAAAAPNAEPPEGHGSLAAGAGGTAAKGGVP